MSLRNLGLTCVGPSSCRNHLCVERCPENVTIDLDTTRFLLTGNGSRTSKLILDCRCVPCHYHHAMTALLVSHGLDAASGSEFCTARGCEEPSFHGSGKCNQHLSHLLAGTHKAKTVVDPKRSQGIFNSAAQKMWTYPSSYGRVLRRI